MRYLRLSHTLKPSGPRFPGNPDLRIERRHSFENGDGCVSHEVTLFNHNGTHIDFPAHYLPEGKGIDAFDMPDFVFDRVCLIELPSGRGRRLEIKDFAPWETEIARAQCVLLKTGYQECRGSEEFPYGPYLSRELAKWILTVNPSLRCLGMDTLSVTSLVARDEGEDVHRLLLAGRGPMIFVEDMDLRLVTKEISRVFIAPWFIEGMDGTPCTAFAELAR